MGFAALIAQARGTRCEACEKDVLARDTTETIDAGIHGMVNNVDIVACMLAVAETVPVLKSIGKMFLRQYLARQSAGPPRAMENPDPPTPGPAKGEKTDDTLPAGGSQAPHHHAVAEQIIDCNRFLSRNTNVQYSSTGAKTENVTWKEVWQ